MEFVETAMINLQCFSVIIKEMEYLSYYFIRTNYLNLLDQCYIFY